MLPGTEERVPQHTAPEVNAEIRRAMKRRIAAMRERPWQIDRRLDQLDQEWDVERVLEANAAAVVLAGAALAVVHDRRWLALPAAAAGFLLQHALQGWCPPLPLVRRLGYRTSIEIDAERMALLDILEEGPAAPPPMARRPDDLALRPATAPMRGMRH